MFSVAVLMYGIIVLKFLCEYRYFDQDIVQSSMITKSLDIDMLKSALGKLIRTLGAVVSQVSN